MKIQIQLYASFRVGRFKDQVRDYPTGTTVGQVFKDLNLPEGDLGVVLVNGGHSSQVELLKDGDVLSFLPLVGGG